jgi:fibronectin-binding autotransporter adhesin
MCFRVTNQIVRCRYEQMNTRYSQINIEPMKNRRLNLTTMAALLGALSLVPAFGQTTVIWTGAGNGTNLATAANWGGTLPSVAAGDTAQFDGVVPGNLVLTYSGGLGGNAGEAGIDWEMTANQTGGVNIVSSVAEAALLAIRDIRIASGAGPFILGGTDGKLIPVIGRPNGALHLFVNDSAHPATITTAMKWRGGGGADFTIAFGGTGDWIVNNYLVMENNPALGVQVDGPGTVHWTPTGVLGKDNLRNPAITMNGGLLILKGPHPRLVNQGIVNNSTIRFDAPSLAQTYGGVIGGGGILEVTNGTLTLSGQSIYTGNTVLGGGRLAVNGVENVGVSGPLGLGTISFLGGTLVFSANNTFDYSSRFDTAAGQKYSFDTAGQAVTFATGLGGNATLTKLGSGTLTLAGASSYSGLTAVGAGKLVFQGGKSGSGSITVSNGAALGIAASGSQVTPATLTLGSGAGAILEFTGIASTTTAPLAATTLSANGTVIINVNSGSFVAGQSYPLLRWTGGSAPTVSLGALNGAVGNVSITGDTLFLNVTALAHVWVGNVDGNWDITTANWKFNGIAGTFTNGAPAFFDDSATGPTDITLTQPVSPSSSTIYSSTKAYSLASSGANLIGGTGGLNKGGDSVLTLSGGVNNYSGPTTISGGVASVGTLGNGGVPSDIGASSSAAGSLVLNGGALQYTGGAASIDRLFTLGTANGMLDASGADALILNNTGPMALAGAGARTLALTGANTADNTLAAVIGDSGGATSVTKSGPGKWVLTGNNTNSGATTIANGILQVGNGGASGSLGSGDIINSGQWIHNRTGTSTIVGDITGSGSVIITNDGTGTLILAGDNSYSGGTTLAAGSLQIGNGGASGSLAPGGAMVNNGTLIFNTTSPITLTAPITGTGNVWVRGSGLVQATGGNSYSGWTTIDPGATFQPSHGNAGALASSIVTNNGTFFLTRQEANPAGFGYSNNIVGTGKLVKENENQNAGWIQLAGTNSYTGGTWIAGGGVVLGDGINPQAGSIVGPVIFTNTATAFLNQRILVFSRADDFTFTNDIISAVTDGSGIAQQGALQQMGPGVVTLSGNNSYPGFTTIDAGMTLIAGTGGTGGSIGTGNLNVEGTFIYNRSADATISGVVGGSGTFVKAGTGSLTLAGNDTFFGSTSVSNGTLYVNGNSTGGGQLYVYGGTLGGAGTYAGAITLDPGTKLAPGANATTVGTFTAASSLDIYGDVAVKLNKSLAQSNDLVVVNGSVQKIGTGTLTVANVGPTAIVAGDKFTLFSQPVVNGLAFTTITGAGATWQNNLADDGSITALTGGTAPVNPNPPVVQVSVSAGTLSLAWPTNRGWTLQTNGVALTAANQWFSYPGSELLTNVNLTIERSKTNVFFRMVLPNNP